MNNNWTKHEWVNENERPQNHEFIKKNLGDWTTVCGSGDYNITMCIKEFIRIRCNVRWDGNVTKHYCRNSD